MVKLSKVPRRTVKHVSSSSDMELSKVHKWMIVWGMMSMLDYSNENQKDWFILSRFQRRYL